VPEFNLKHNGNGSGVPTWNELPNKVVDWGASKLGLSPHETFIPKLIGLEEILRFLRGEGGK
jgi:hypothetical protein